MCAAIRKSIERFLFLSQKFIARNLNNKQQGRRAEAASTTTKASQLEAENLRLISAVSVESGIMQMEYYVNSQGHVSMVLAL